ncbi:MAG: HXXEE domain-containing protein [Bryobacterales bacterium]|nr:HXXEE domain-containing protein [Bryobacterales bacterium]
MRFHRLLWLFPVAVTLHNAEEAIAFPPFALEHAARLPLLVSPAAFRFALAVLTLAAWLVTYCAWRRGPRSLSAHLFFGCAAAMLINVFVPHIPAALRFAAYTPGLLTAVFVNLPVMSLLLYLAWRDGFVHPRRALAFGVAVPIGIAAAAAMFFHL